MTIVLLFLVKFNVEAQTPELLYYTFTGSGIHVENEAGNPPVGTEQALIVGNHTKATGSFNGSDGNSDLNYLDTKWTPNLGNSSWTVNFWSINNSTNTNIAYVFGDDTSNGWRIFTNGVAGSGNWIMRGPTGNLRINGGATTQKNMNTWIYNNSDSTLQTFLNGQFIESRKINPLNINGVNQLKIGGYSTKLAMHQGIKMDNFGLYNRALSSIEVNQLYNNDLDEVFEGNEGNLFCPDDIEYCNAIAGFSGFEWNQEVTFNGMTAATGNNGGYISYIEDETKQVNVSPNGIVNLSLTPGFAYWPYHVGWKIFVDWNQNGDFDDAGELMYSGFSYSVQSGQFTVPVDVEEGCYAIRIANAWGAYPSTGCSNIMYGEIEDYKLSVEGIQPPQARKASPVVADVDHISYDFEFAANQVLISQGEEIDITLRSRNSGNSQFNISNSLGQIVSSINVNHQEGIGSIQVSTANLSKGIYFIGNSKTVNAIKVIIE
jgi:hypothetical protein